MALNRYTNYIDILNSSNTIEGTYLLMEHLYVIDYKAGIVSDYNRDALDIESHFYNTLGDYLKSNYNTPYKYYPKFKDFVFDVSKVFDEAGLYSGEYKMCLTFLINLLGTPKDKPFTVSEISPDRREIKLIVKEAYLQRNPSIALLLNNFKHTAGELKKVGSLNNIVLNFSENKMSHVVNMMIDCEDELIVYVKLYRPLPDDLNISNSCCLSYKVVEDYIETILLKPEEQAESFITLRPPSFSGCETLDVSHETSIKSWDNLLDTNSTTSTRILNEILSGSEQVTLNLDFTDFSSFVKYGSAEERVKNFDYKYKLLEYYDSNKNAILSSSSSLSPFVSDLSDKYTKRKDALVSTFDFFEKHLYYGSGSLFTHDLTGSINPVPKYLSGSNYYNYISTSPQYESWYSSLLEEAKSYDGQNYSSFYFNTPDHILRDENNSEYITFIHMIGQHFDNIYTYVDNLTSIHRRDEHPERGIPNELLPYYVRSLGWRLQNSKSLSDLWLYKLGLDSTGSMGTPTGDLISQTHESLNNQVWRRIVNNLPYLLKTKGSERSVKALFSIYGIPNTLISIKEYGGPQVDESSPPILAEDRFQYLLEFEGSQYIEFERGLVTSSLSNSPLVPQTTEFRFRTTYKTAPSMSMWAVENSANRSEVLQNLEIVHSSSSFYGQDTYGYLKYTHTSGSSTIATSSMLPLYDGDIWSVRMYAGQPLHQGSSFNGTLYFNVAKASDFIDERVSFSSSFQMNGIPSSVLYVMGAQDPGHYVLLGGTTGSNSQRFVGHLQSYREYFDTLSETNFYQKVLNPAAYYGSSYSSSFDSLYRFYTLGSDVIRNDLAAGSIVSSSHPNQSFYGRNTAIAYNFTGTQSTQYEGISEKYFIAQPSLGANVAKSRKIRIESSTLVGDLSPDRKAEKSQYDSEPLDSNRLAIVFSPTDQINRDIANQFGAINFENFVGNPEHSSKSEYPDLRRAQNEYFKKFTKGYDIGKFIEIFSLYDYTVFEQLRQLIPARANLITGVLIEPSILERSKIKRETLGASQLNYDTSLRAEYKEISSYNIDIPQALLTHSIDLELERIKEKTTLTHSLDLDFEKIKEQVSFKPEVDVEADRVKYSAGANIRPYHFDTENSGDRVYRGDFSRKTEIFASGLFSKNSFGDAITPQGVARVIKDSGFNDGSFSKLEYFSGELVDVTDTFTYKRDGQTYTVNTTTKVFQPFTFNPQVVYRNLSNNDVLNKEEYANGIFEVTLGGSPVVFNTSQLGDVDYMFTFTIYNPDLREKTLNGVQFLEFLQTYNFRIYTGNNTIFKEINSDKTNFTFVTGSRVNPFVKKIIYHYSSSGAFVLGTTSPNMLNSPVYLNSRTGSKSDYQKEFDYALNKAYNAHYSSSLGEFRYQHFSDGDIMRSRYKGSKMRGADFNVDSSDTLTGSPVVTITYVDDNEIIF